MEPIKNAVSAAMSHEKTPLILTVMGCTGVVVTAVMAARAAPKARHILEEEKAYRLKDRLPLKTVIKKTWKLYLPAFLVGGVTIGSIITMNRVSSRNAAILSASAAVATNTLRVYQEHVLEEIGAEKDSKIRDKMAKRLVSNETTLSDSTTDLMLFSGDGGVAIESLTGRYFRFNGGVEDLRAIENHMNHEIISQGYVSLNDLYEALGLDPTDLGYAMGFNADNMVNFHFSAQLGPKNTPVLVLGFITPPVTGYNY